MLTIGKKRFTLSAGLLAVALLGSMLSPSLTPTADARPHQTTLSATKTKVLAGKKVQLRINHNGSPNVVKFTVQKKSSKGWRVVGKRKVVDGKNVYRLKVKVTKGSNKFRVRSHSKNKVVSISNVVTVKGKKNNGASSALASARSTILDEVNKERANKGLAKLKMNPAMNTVAQKWAKKMADDGKLKHNPNYSSQIPDGWTRAAENVAMGYSPESVVEAWMHSPGHRKNILGDYTHIGIGWYEGDTTWGVQNFAKY